MKWFITFLLFSTTIFATECPDLKGLYKKADSEEYIKIEQSNDDGIEVYVFDFKTLRNRRTTTFTSDGEAREIPLGTRIVKCEDGRLKTFEKGMAPEFNYVGYYDEEFYLSEGKLIMYEFWQDYFDEVLDWEFTATTEYEFIE